jgi:hypothetical protein
MEQRLVFGGNISLNKILYLALLLEEVKATAKEPARL